MQVIDLTKPTEEKKQGGLKSLRAVLQFGNSEKAAQQAQEKVISVLRALLDTHYLLVRGLRLPGQEEPLPPLLVGPQGAYLLAVWHKPGFYRIREGYWEVLQRNHYRLAKPNEVQKVLMQAAAAEKFLERILHTHVPVKPMMIFTNPGTDVDSVRPAVRPLLIDGLKRFVSRMVKEEETVLTPQQVLDVFEAVSPTVRAESAVPKRKPHPKPRREPQALRKVERTLNFTKRQWIILGVLASITMCVTIGVIFYVLYAASTY